MELELFEFCHGRVREAKLTYLNVVHVVTLFFSRTHRPSAVFVVLRLHVVILIKSVLFKLW